MPTIPEITVFSSASTDILNAIRNESTINYQNYVPIATQDAESIKEIGAIIMDNPALQNEFITTLVNRIGRVILTSKMYENPWAIFKKGMIELGETVEEIFVNLANPFQFDGKKSETDMLKRVIPDVRTAFHVMNYQKFYKDTISSQQLKQAFLSWQGLNNLIAGIIDSMYKSANYDEFLVMKYLLARRILKGQCKVVTVSAVETANMPAIVSKIKATSNKLEFLSPDYNLAGVHNSTPKTEQYILLNSDFDAKMDVEVLASAFNLNKAEFMGRRILVDGFGELDRDRLDELFEHDSTYTKITAAEQTALNLIPAVLLDADWFMIFDNLIEFDQFKNPEGLSWQYWLHVWKTFSTSPFSNNAVFVPGTPTITSVTVAPDAVTMSAGQTLNLTATVVTTNYAPKSVDWSTLSEEATVSKAGVVTIADDATGGDAGTITITATSTFDATKSDDCVITIASGD